MNKKPIPTEQYPRLLWYQEKRIPCTEEERNIIFKRYYEVSMGRLLKLFPTSVEESLHELAEEKANILVEAEVNLPTIMRKVLVNSMKEHRLTKQMLEESDIFLQWYKE